MRRPAPGGVRTRLIRSTVVGVVTVVVLILLWRHFDASGSLAPVSPQPLWITLALLGAALFLVGRAWRLHALLGGRLPLLRLLGLTGVSWGAGLLLPGPSADAAFVVLARRDGIGARRGTGVAVLGRLMDVVSLAVIIIVAAFFDGISTPHGPILVAGVCGLACLLVLVASLIPAGRRMLVRLLGVLPRTRALASGLDDALGELSDSRTLLLLALGTVVCRLATLMEYGAMFAMIGVPLNIWGIWFVLAVRTFLSTVPVQGIAGLGTGQIWWTSALVLEGVSGAAAVGISITLSLLDLAASAPLVFLSWLLLRGTPARTTRPSLAGARVAPKVQRG